MRRPPRRRLRRRRRTSRPEGLCAARRLWQMRGMASEPPEPSRWLPPVVLAAIVLLLLAGWFLFPRFQAYMARQDCIASGHINCD
jgi:hypothetical protein